MSVQVKRRRDTAANVAAFTGAQGELIVDTTNNRVTVHDGSTSGGWAAAKLSEIVPSLQPAFRNRLRNPTLSINQRGVSGTVTLAAGVYGHDGVKAGASGATYTFAASGLDTTLTISAGSLILPIETLLIEGGSYMLSQAGTAQARVWQGTGYTGSGSYAAAPFTAAGLTVATQTNVEFSTGTVLRPQFEPGAVATAFERRPPGVELNLCQRYFEIGGDYNLVVASVATQYVPAGTSYKASKCAAPTLTFTNVYLSNVSSATPTLLVNTRDCLTWERPSIAAGVAYFYDSWSSSAEL